MKRKVVSGYGIVGFVGIAVIIAGLAVFIFNEVRETLCRPGEEFRVAEIALFTLLFQPLRSSLALFVIPLIALFEGNWPSLCLGLTALFLVVTGILLMMIGFARDHTPANLRPPKIQPGDTLDGMPLSEEYNL